MKNTTFYAICAKGLGDEDGFYKVEAEKFDEVLIKHKDLWDDKSLSVKELFEKLTQAKDIIFCKKVIHKKDRKLYTVIHKPVAFVVEVNPSLTKRPIISFETQIEQKESSNNIFFTSQQDDERYYKNLCTYINDLKINERFKFEFQGHVCEVIKYKNPFGKYFCVYINAKCKISPTEVELIDKKFSGEITYALKNTLAFDMGHSHIFKNKNSTDVNLCLSLLKELCTILKEFNTQINILSNFEMERHIFLRTKKEMPDDFEPCEKSPEIVHKDAQRELINDMLADESEPIILHQEFNDIQNAENNAKIINEALKNKLITKAKEDCKRLKAIFAKTKVDTAIYFENECGEIKSLWFERDEIEQYGAIKVLIRLKKVFVVADFVATEVPFIRVCKGYETEFIDEYEPKDYE